VLPNDYLAAASFVPNSIEPPDAWIGHLPFAAWMIREVAPAIFVELGTHSGNSYFSFCQSVAENGIPTLCYAVDTWQGDAHAGGYGEEVFARLCEHNEKYFANFSQVMRMSFDAAVTHFADGSIELLHIDGLHTYEAVRHDFETWLPKLAPGAVVMFHDTHVREHGFGVWKLWQELQTVYANNLEFTHSHGLGVLQLNDAPEDKRLEWLRLGALDRQVLTDYFAALGLRQVERFESGELKRKIENLNLNISNLNIEISNLHLVVLNRDAQIAELNRAIASIRATNSWRLTQPFRNFKRWLSR
jgi:hypothetical protein